MAKPHNKCLYCYQPITGSEIDFHVSCSRKFFGQETPPELTFDKAEIKKLAKEIVIRSVALTGVQAKLSLTIEKVPDDPKHSRFTIVGLWGDYILKPPADEYEQLPENEDLTMHLAQLLKIKTAEHSLVRLKSGEIAYITKRFDRTAKGKLAMEDMCQLTETLTEDKYRGSHERIGKKIQDFTSHPGIDAISFFELTLFSFLVGNADMHLKNFSLLTTSDNYIIFSPAYDLLSTKLALPEDKEELALTLNGKKNKLNRTDFDTLAKYLRIHEKTIENIYNRFSAKTPFLLEFIDESFLNAKMKRNYKQLLRDRAKRIY